MSGLLPHWLERLLGVETWPGERAVWRLETVWPWPAWVTLLLLAAIVGVVVAIYLRESPEASRRYRLALAVVRLAALGTMLLMLAQLSLGLRRTGLPYLAVVLDDSLSMSLADHYEEQTRLAMEARVRAAAFEESPLTRWRLAQTLLCEHEGALLANLANRYKLRIYLLSTFQSLAESEPAALAARVRAMQPVGETTRLGAGVRAVLEDLRGAPPAALVLLTDGINTEGPSLVDGAAMARRREVPLFCVGLGSETAVRDLTLSDLLVDDIVFVNDLVSFDCQLTASGFQGKPVEISLRTKDDATVLARASVIAGPDGKPLPVRLLYRPNREGIFHYVVEAEPQKDEAQTENNRLEAVVEARKEKIRVLLAQATPSYEYRFLRNMLARDETIELRTFLQEADVEHAEQDRTALRVFPVRQEELHSYDVIILSDADPALLGASVLQNLVEFVDQPGKGGALVLIAGPRYLPLAYRNTPLEKLFPFNPALARLPQPAQSGSPGFHVRPTEQGAMLPPLQLGDTPAETRGVWQNLAPVRWLLEVPALKPGARALLEHPEKTGQDGSRLPVACLHYVGAGKVLFHATDETHRWRWRVGDVYFARYWLQMLRFLARAKLAQAGRLATVSTDQGEYRRGESVRLRVRFFDERLAPAEDDGVTVVVERTGGQRQRITLHRTAGGRGYFEGLLSKPAVGSYRAWLAVPALGPTAHAPQESPAAPGPAITTAHFVVKPPAGELDLVPMDAAALRRAAEETKGRFYTFETATELLRDLPPGQLVPTETLPSIPLWNRWPTLLVLLTLLIAEWALRRLKGMV